MSFARAYISTGCKHHRTGHASVPDCAEGSRFSMNQSVNGGTNWFFPILPNDDIVKCINELGIPMSMSDLEKPTPGKIQLMYSAFLDILMGLSKEYFDAAVDACAGEADHFDMYADTLLLVNFFRNLQRLMREVGYAQFNLQDLIKPDGVRMRKILSAIINFAKFREEQFDVYLQLTDKSRENLEKHDELLQRNERLIREVEELKIRRIREEPLMAQARATNEGLKNELFELKRQQALVVGEYDKLRQEKKGLTARLDNDVNLLETTRREIQKISSRIVHSPEKLKQQLADMSSSLTNEKTFLNDKSKKTRELTAKIDLLTTAEEDVLSCIRMMEECDAGLERLDGARKRVTQVEELVDKKRFEVLEFSSREEQLKGQLDNARERLEKAIATLESKREATRARMDRITEEKRSVQAERLQIDTEMEKKRALVESMQIKIIELREDVGNEVAKVNAEFGVLTSHIDLYMKEVQATMNQSGIVV